ncbi:hypothetical protein BGZ81_004937 [Podila clonocystis]|nr:hypothetical protein BGZ81_004937 [Podila clonocystis]
MATMTEALIHAAVSAISAEYAQVIIETLDTLAKAAAAAAKNKLQEYFVLPLDSNENVSFADVASLIDGPKAGFLSELDDAIDTIVRTNLRHEGGKTIVNTADVQFSVEALFMGRLRPLFSSVDTLTLARVVKAVQGQITLKPDVVVDQKMEGVRLGLSLERFMAELQGATVAGRDLISKAFTAFH